MYFDAVFVGFVSETRITAVVPAETQAMPVDTYDVFVTNPDQLSAQWKIRRRRSVTTRSCTSRSSIRSIPAGPTALVERHQP